MAGDGARRKGRVSCMSGNEEKSASVGVMIQYAGD